MNIDEELGVLVTINGAYFNLWVEADASGEGWVNTEAYDAASRLADDPSQWRGLYGVDITVVMDTAEKLLASLLAEDEEE